MANYNNLKAGIDAVIKTNGRQEISGAALNAQLKNMITELGAGYQFMGVATPTNPGTAQTPDYKCFYLATTPGTYTNLGGLVVAEGEVAILKYDTAWTKQVTGAATADKLNQLGQEVDDIEVGKLPVSFTEMSGYINTAGTPTESTHYNYTSPIPVKKGQTLFVNTAGYSFCVISQYINGAYTPLVNIPSGDLNVPAEFSYTASEDCYLVACFKIDGNSYGVTLSWPIYDRIGEIDNKVDEVNYENAVPYTGYEELDYSVNANNMFGTSGAYQHACYPVSSGENYVIKASQEGSRYALVTTSAYEQGGDIPLVSGYSVVVLGANKIDRITIPNGCTHLLVYNVNNVRPFNVRRNVAEEVEILDGEISRIASASSNGILKIDTDYNRFTLTAQTKVIYGGKEMTIAANTNISYNPSTTIGAIVVDEENSRLVTVSFANAKGRYIFATYTINNNGRNVPFVSWCAIGTDQERANWLVGGFSAEPINIDNVNGKFVWGVNHFYRINGQPYTVLAGELPFSSYSGGGVILGLALILTDTEISSGVFEAQYEIVYNSLGVQPHAIGNYIVAWFIRSGSSWAAGPVLSVLSNLPFSIDGEREWETYFNKERGRNIQELELGTFVNKGNDANGLPGNDSSERAGADTTIALPYPQVTVTIHAPSGFLFQFRSGIYGRYLPTNGYWYSDGDTYTFPAGDLYYRTVIARKSGDDYVTINASEVNGLVSSGNIRITYEGVDLDSVKRNLPSDDYAKAVIHRFYLRSNDNGMDKYPTFIHTTDIHGDFYRLRDAIELSKVYTPDAILVTGDVNAYNIMNGFSALEKLMVNSPVPSLYCRGNHETYENTDVSLNVFAKYYQSLATKWGYLLSSGSVTNKTYYYKDFADKKIRVISLDQYEKNLTTNNTGAYSQDQIDWFIATLLSTPADYGVICILHSPEAYPTDENSIEPITGKDAFFSTTGTFGAPLGLTSTPLRNIVDAFISKGTLVTSFTQTETGGVSATINIDADFTGVNSGVEFIAWVCGHEHQDFIGKYKNTTNKQIVLNMACGVCYYGNSTYPYLNDLYDMPRGAFGVTQDAINIYSIDRGRHQIRIARIGTNVTNGLTERKAMIISYVD